MSTNNYNAAHSEIPTYIVSSLRSFGAVPEPANSSQEEQTGLILHGLEGKHAQKGFVIRNIIMCYYQCYLDRSRAAMLLYEMFHYSTEKLVLITKLPPIMQ